MDNTINHVCICGSESVDIMSVVEKTLEKDNKTIPIVEITYVCKCGNSQSETHYLYKTNKQEWGYCLVLAIGYPIKKCILSQVK